MVDYKLVFQQERLKQGYSQYKMAKLVGISQTSVWEIENGRKKPSLDVFFRICEILNITVELLPNEETQA